MRYVSSKPLFFIIVVLSIALYIQQGGASAGATSAMPAVGGEAVMSPESSLAINLPFAQILKQTARDGAANDNYGCSVAAENDVVVVGANLDTVGNNAQQGSAYVFVRSGPDWTLQQKLTVRDGEAQDRFGESVAISGDTIVIGAPYDKTGTNSYQGSAYVFVHSGGVWSFQQKLTAHDGEGGDQFGAAVAISGDTIVAGAFSDNVGANSDQGSAHVFVRSGGVWSFQQKLTAGDGEANDQFGAAVAISGGTVIAGAPLDNSGTNPDTGSAYVFVRSGTIWAQRQRLVANIARSTDLFGMAVAISGDTAIIGSPLADPFGTPDQGSAFIFVRSNGVWSYQRDLWANDGAAGDQFGRSVAINGETALVGAHFDDVDTNLDQGSAYLFTRSGSLWAPRQRFTAQRGAARELFGQSVALSGEIAVAGAPHARIGENESQGALYLFGCGHAGQQTFTGNGSEAFDSFSFAMAVDGDTAVVGAPNDDVGKNARQGSAYVFVRSGSGWTQSAQLFAFDGAAYDHFGYSVAISGDSILIGAPWKTIGGNLQQGAAYFFVRSAEGWKLQARPFGNAKDDYFGWSVALSGDLAAVSTPHDVVGENMNQGSVTIYNRSGTTWSLEKTLTANDGEAFDYFGRSLAFSGDRLLVGAPGPSEGERSKGAAYVFERSSALPQPWVQRAKLIAADGEYLDHLGNSVAISGNTALVSAPGKVIHNPLRRQAAYVFVAPGAPGGAWSQQTKLILGEGYPYGSLSVALSGNTAVVGTSTEYVDGSYNQGMTRVFTRSGAVWTPQQQIVAGDGRIGDGFGVSVAIGGDTILAGAVQGGGIKQGAVYVLRKICSPAVAPAPFASVSAASFAAGGELSPESIVAGFGANLATETQAAGSIPLPTTLAGVTLKVRDAAGVERPAPLFFVSPGQINYMIPAGTVAGQATLTVSNSAGLVASGAIQISNVAPGLFSANSSGQGVAVALVLRVKANGSQIYEPVARFDSAQNRFVAIPIDLGPAGDQVYLLLYGTGLRHRSSLSAVSCAIGGVNSEALFVGAAPGFVGFDQVNVRLPRSLAGRGELDLALVVDGKPANTLRLSIR